MTANGHAFDAQEEIEALSDRIDGLEASRELDFAERRLVGQRLDRIDANVQGIGPHIDMLAKELSKNTEAVVTHDKMLVQLLEREPPRAPELSSTSLEALVPDLAQAAVAGERAPDTTAEDMVRQVLAKVIREREAAEEAARLRAELERLRAAEAKRLEDEAKAKEQAIRNRRDRRNAVIKWGAGIIGSAFTGYIVKALTEIHWH